MNFKFFSKLKILVAFSIFFLFVLSFTTDVHAIVTHGATIAKGCDSPKMPGESTSCDIVVGYNDAAGDTISVDEAWDVEDIGGDNVRVPAVGSLPISAVSGNTTCVAAGALPCLIGPAGSTLNGLPGSGVSGAVTFHSDTYVIQANDPDPLPDQGNAKVHDLCDNPNTSGCSTLSNTIQFTSQTDLKFNPSVVTNVHDVSHNIVTSVPLGTTVHDNAVVSGSHGTPTGTVNFKRYANTTCTGASTDENNVLLNGSGVAESSDFATNSTAGLSYKAHYNGDNNYNAKDGDCESLTVIKLVSIVRTEVHDPNHVDITNTTVPVGVTVHDKAFVTGGGPTPTGTVDFARYATNDCTGGSINQDNVILAGDGTVESAPFAPVAGFVSYKVHYDGDDNYGTSDGICEPLTVEKLTPTVRTEVHDANHVDITNTAVNAGTIVHDKAFVGGTGGNPTGTVDFMRYTNGTCTGGPADTQSGVILDSTGNPAFAESDTFTTVAGAMAYKVHYSGDGVYKEGLGVCEPLTVQEIPQGCTLTQGYWKNHESEWPVNMLTLGSVSYTKTQLLSILRTPVKGNGIVSLAHQLIAAKLNIASGASPASISAVIASADTMIGGLVVPPVGNGFLPPGQTSPLISQLDSFNSGTTGPGHCSQ